MRFASLSLTLAVSSLVTAQVPDGWFAYCSFQSSLKGETGVFFAHPRTPGNPVRVTGLTGDLAWVPNHPSTQGAACLLRRPSDGALIVGERAPKDHSVDVHVITLRGTEVLHDHSISVGTSAGVGEIPQLALLPDGRILVSATDLSGGPLAVIHTTNYNWEGIGIVDPVAGSVTPVPIGNPNILVSSVFNGMTVSADGATCYIGTYVSGTQGDVYALPIPGGGMVTQIAQVPAGLSNMALDVDGSLLIATLNGPPNLFRYSFATQQVTAITTAVGPLNAVAVEAATGDYAVLSANAGIPSRSVFWMTRNGADTLLASPNTATLSGIDVNHNPEAFGPASPGTNQYTWRVAPNPGGLPQAGNQAFDLTLDISPGMSFPAFHALSLGRLAQPIDVAGAKMIVDPVRILVLGVQFPTNQMKVALPIPADPNLVGVPLYVQTFHLEATSQLASSSCVEFSVL